MKKFVTQLGYALFTVLLVASTALLAFGATTDQVPPGSLPFTGDHTPFLLIAVVMGVALVIIIGILISMRRKK